ncbi:MAG: methyltransferase [Pseudomonadota bacterium]
MINLLLPEPLMWALRWALLLGPIALVILVATSKKVSRRAQVGALFALLYGLGTVFVTHQAAMYLGWWHYGWDALMLMGMPADILFGGAILFGPVLYLLFPNSRPMWICLPIILLMHGTVFSSLEPLVIAGPGWFVGVVAVFLVAHIPAIYLARWTETDTQLPLRVALLAIMFGANAFVLLPSIIMAAMGGSWDLDTKSLLDWMVALPAFLVACVVGVSAAQMLALQGLGTAIPLDPTKRLVRTGIYSYVNNPMQLSSVLCWLVIGVFLQNIWVALSALMAWIFVNGMVRWHHKNDLLQRFPDGWPEYRSHVPEWIPRRRPWVKENAKLRLDSNNRSHAALGKLLSTATGLHITSDIKGSARYDSPLDARGFSGAAAISMALTHINVIWMLIGQTGLLFSLMASYCTDRLSTWRPT